jgi:hypothetical protein
LPHLLEVDMNWSPLYLALMLAAIAPATLAQQANGGSPGATVCGGVGQGEQQRMKDAARDHSLMLTFATANGSYLADVSVRISDSRGTAVVEAHCDGPIMLVDLPTPGSYRVTAQAGGITRTRNVTLARGRRPATATLTWPDGTS